MVVDCEQHGNPSLEGQLERLRIDPQSAYSLSDDARETAARLLRWDRSYLRLARFWAEERSKDPSTRVGAVVVNINNQIEAVGYNGFPVGVEDSPERYNDRETKYKLVVHAEPNALLTASRTSGSTIYTWPFAPCADCAKLIVQAGIRRVVSLESERKSWSESWETAELIMREAGVSIRLYPQPFLDDE